MILCGWINLILCGFPEFNRESTKCFICVLFYIFMNFSLWTRCLLVSVGIQNLVTNLSYDWKTIKLSLVLQVWIIRSMTIIRVLFCSRQITVRIVRVLQFTWLLVSSWRWFFIGSCYKISYSNAMWVHTHY